MNEIPTCPVCGSNAVELVSLRDMPVLANELWPTAAEAKAAPKGDIDLAYCSVCAMIWNRSFDPDRMVYAPGYENALHHSPTFRRFAEDLADELVQRFDLVGKDVIEIGSGDGHILSLLAGRGVVSATGYDPSMKDRPSPFTEREGVEIVAEYFEAGRVDRPYDAVLCRHVIEHLEDPAQLLGNLRSVIGDRKTPVYFEAPNALWMVDSVSIWDVIYEHVGYWTKPSFETAFRRAGFAPLSLKTRYGDQFLSIEATPTIPEPNWTAEDVSGTVAAISAFGEASRNSIAEWRAKFAGRTGRSVIWGAGSKGITFNNAVAPGIDALVDLNPKKHGRFVPGTGAPVIDPSGLRDLAPDLVLIANGLYEAEIRKTVQDDLGLSPEFAIIAG